MIPEFDIAVYGLGKSGLLKAIAFLGGDNRNWPWVDYLLGFGLIYNSANGEAFMAKGRVALGDRSFLSLVAGCFILFKSIITRGAGLVFFATFTSGWVVFEAKEDGSVVGSAGTSTSSCSIVGANVASREVLGLRGE